MADEPDLDDLETRIAELEARLDEQADQLRLFWGFVVFGLVTVILFVLAPMVGVILGLMGMVFAFCIALARLT